MLTIREIPPILFVPSWHPAIETASLSHWTSKKTLSADTWFIHLTADSVVDISSFFSNVRLLIGPSASFQVWTGVRLTARNIVRIESL